jgi:hypothetical protein
MVDSLKEDSFENIWFSEKYNSYRVAAKYIERNKDMSFARGEKLFDGKCHSCENVNQHFDVLRAVGKYSLKDFL